ncbi:hypothetical protein G4B88_027666 [Cannabis sativa]|uniref:Uncharacterized protein n=1 Tax=Cannabis sativa TaxID=3483 RepID=A0A7J6DPA4_CANSA|nr:hypothetical protein G4B88_027666 [Cannabis sativa]
MDSSTILIASFMIFSIGRTTVSGLNFDPYFFLHIVKEIKVLFLLFPNVNPIFVLESLRFRVEASLSSGLKLLV